MLLIAWMVLGVITGFAASKVVNKEGSQRWLDLCLGAAGAVIGGFLFHTFATAGSAYYGLYSIAMPALGATVVLLIQHRLPRETATATV